MRSDLDINPSELWQSNLEVVLFAVFLFCVLIANCCCIKYKHSIYGLEHLEYIHTVQYSCIYPIAAFVILVFLRKIFLSLFLLRQKKVIYLRYKQQGTGFTGFGLDRNLCHCVWWWATVLCRIHLALYPKDVCSYCLNAISTKDNLEMWGQSPCSSVIKGKARAGFP